jgi:hypothetical protein
MQLLGEKQKSLKNILAYAKNYREDIGTIS